MQKVRCSIHLWFNCLLIFNFTLLPSFFNFFFFPFPHGTCTLSIIILYLGLAGGPAEFNLDYTCPNLLLDINKLLFYMTDTFYGNPFKEKE